MRLGIYFEGPCEVSVGDSEVKRGFQGGQGRIGLRFYELNGVATQLPEHPWQLDFLNDGADESEGFDDLAPMVNTMDGLRKHKLHWTAGSYW